MGNPALQEAEREYQETAAELMQEVSLSVPAISESEVLVSTPTIPISIPQSGVNLHVQAPQDPNVTILQSVPMSVDDGLLEMRE